MKKTKRLLAYVLAFAMVLSCVAGKGLTAKATSDEADGSSMENAVEVQLDDSKLVVIDEAGEHYWVKFTPTEDGKYVFYSQGTMDTEAYLYDAEEELAHDDDGLMDEYCNFKIVYQMTAGTTYYLDSMLLDDEEIGDYELHIVKATSATAISFDEEYYKGYVGETLCFDLLLTPLYAADEYTYEVDKEGIIEIDTDCDYAELVGLGTVTVTVTTAGGVSDTCTIEVLGKESIKVGETKTVEVARDEEVRFVFTPETDGTYVFYSDDIESGVFWLYETNSGGGRWFIGSSYWDGDSVVISAELQAGVTYEYSCNKYEAGTYSVSLVKAEVATGIAIDRDTIEGYPSDEFYLDAELAPRFSITEETTWSSSDVTVATVDEYGQVQLKKEGTATITVKTASGLTDTCKVTVKAVQTIALDTKTTVKITEADTAMTYAFTPTKDGTYAFYSETKHDTFGSIHTQDGEWVSSDDDSGENYNFLVEVNLKAGETYYLKASYLESLTGSFDVYLTEMKTATEMSFSYSSLTGYVDEMKWIDVTFGPGYAKSEEFILEVADESVAQIGEQGIELLKAGTTKLIATSENGLTCECTITVKEPETLVLDQEMKLEIQEDQEHVYFTYTPSESGTYTFYSTDDNNGYGTLFNSEGEWLTGDGGSGVGDNFKIVADLEANAAYTFVYQIWDEDCSSVSVKLQKAADKITGIELSHSSIKGYVGRSAQVYLDVLPENSPNTAQRIAWESSNEEVAEIYQVMTMGDPYCYFDLKTVGTATITATLTTEDGDVYTDTCVVTVQKPEEMKVNDTKNVNIEYKEDYLLYAFTPEKDGTYIISTDADAQVRVVVMDADYMPITYDYGTDENPNASLEVELKAGKTYYIATGYENSKKTGTYQITLIDKDNPLVDNSQNGGTNNQGTTTTSPKTGDANSSWTWIMVMVVAVGAACGVVVYRKKKSE